MAVGRLRQNDRVEQRYEFSAELWLWQARVDSWVFARLPADVSAEIADVPRPRAGFGSVRVTVTLGASRWQTSIFPEVEGCYVVPIKKAVRLFEGIEAGDTVVIGIEPEA